MSSAHKDKQYVAIATIDDGSVWFIDYRMPEGMTHRLVRAAGDNSTLFLDIGDILTPDGWHDALKISRTSNAVITVGTVMGGEEDVVDITWCKNVKVNIVKAVVQGRYLATIKGGCDGVQVIVDQQIGHGKYADFDLGNWFDFNSAKTVRTILGSVVADGSQVTCRTLNADKPNVLPNQKWKINKPWWQPFFWSVMKLAKKLKLA